MKKFFASFCSIFFIVSLCFGMVLLNIEKSFSKESIKKVIAKVDFATVLEEENDTVSEVYQTLEELGIQKEQIDSILNSEIIKEVTSDIINNAFDYYLRSKENVKMLTEEQLEKYIKELLASCKKIVDIPIGEEEEQKIYDAVKPTLKEIQQAFPSIQEVEQIDPQLNKVITSTKFLFQIETKCLVLVIFALSAIGIFCLRKRNSSYLTWYGVDILITSILLFLFYVLAKLLTPAILTEDWNEVITFLSSFLNRGLITALILFVLAIVLFILHHFVTKKEKEVA